MSLLSEYSHTSFLIDLKIALIVCYDNWNYKYHNLHVCLFIIIIFSKTGETPTITNLASSMTIEINEYVAGNTITTFDYADQNTKDVLTLSYTLSPNTGVFTLNDLGMYIYIYETPY